jgi:FkbM family methyltransferase
LIISSLLEKSENLVTLESDVFIANQLNENKQINNMNFHIENAALSKRLLIQKNWDTVPFDSVPVNVNLDGFQRVNTISLSELRNKYLIHFDTLVLDCEGAFYFILLDMPEILENINLIIMENDYWCESVKQYVDNVLKLQNFYIHYSESGGMGPCQNNFYEVWKKRIPIN